MTAISQNQDPKPLVELKELKKYFPIHKGFLRREVGAVRAVDDVSFYINEGETVGLVGESGCGKTTTARCIVKAIDATAGEIMYRTVDGSTVDLTQLSNAEMRPLRRDIQMIFQDPFSSLNPRMTIFEIISEPLLVNNIGTRQEREDRVHELLNQVGLRQEFMQRFPHAFSGGQRQRIGIARALAAQPRLIIADEPVSGLDVSVQAVVLNLLEDLKHRLGMSYLFISHDLNVVRLLCDRIMVMRNGAVVEEGDADQLLDNPETDYTRTLLAAIPHPPEPEGNKETTGAAV